VVIFVLAIPLAMAAWPMYVDGREHETRIEIRHALVRAVRTSFLATRLN
jgi:hypothetical protein